MNRNRRKADHANEQWQRHSDDEARARAAQQESAGGTHQPVEGPPPYGNEQVNLIAAEIEREVTDRCARLVETWPVGAGDEAAAGLLRDLAQAIRRTRP
ncbi:hypothetical protein EZ313_05610 [Ramlibacter henchirensis]|uniref:Uncharacterized protein n=1 Tax=Ramlibacter henchirensis TaxID=204072 RepID=A0A4Z0C7Q6_9BURK|nr:hypothetical protein [Ramlibacter henchirensis]TFZ06119.1 hypothetical protein EZ313_05610 [Ramlibacter henchirensis]